MRGHQGIKYFMTEIGTAVLLAAILWVACTQKRSMDPTSPLTREITQLVVEVEPSKINMNGEQALIRIRLVDQNNTPLSGKVITFTTTLGIISPKQVSTGSDGYAQTFLTSGQISGDAKITIAYDELVKTITIQISPPISPLKAQILLTPMSTEMLANGLDNTDIQVMVQGDSGKIISGTRVALSTSFGTLSSDAIVTNSAGYGSLIFTSDTTSQDIMAVITASSDTLPTVQTTILCKAVQFNLGAIPVEILADGKSQSQIKAVLKEKTSLIAVNNARVTFATNLGLIAKETTTDNQGVGQVALTSGISRGTALVYARYGKTIERIVQVELVSQTESQFSLSPLRVTRSSILANEIDETELAVTITDQDKNPVAEDTVHFETTSGILSSEWAITNSSGIANTLLTARSSAYDSMATVTASRGNGTQSVTTTIHCEGVEFTVSVDPSIILADGKNQSTVSSILKRTTSKIAISNGRLTFGTDLGTIPGEATTNSAGVAQVSLTSAETEGTATISVRYGPSFEKQVSVIFVTEEAEGLFLTDLKSSKQSLMANGIDQTDVSVKVVDEESKPISGVPVNFMASKGRITSQGISGANGVATVQLTSSANFTDVMDTVTAQLTGADPLHIAVFYEGIYFELQAAPLSIIANGKSESQITAILKRATTNIAISNGSIQFGTSLGSIPVVATTNAQGFADNTLTSSKTTGTAHVTAIYGQTLQRSLEIEFEESIPTYLEVSALPLEIPADGQTQSIITATINDNSQRPVPDGTEVKFEIVTGSGSINSPHYTIEGMASSSLTSTTVGNVTVQVKVDGLSKTVQVNCKVGAVNQIIFSDIPEFIMADGVDTAPIEVTVMDVQSHPVQNAIVNYSATLGDITPSVKSGFDGTAVAQFSSNEVGISTISASVDNISVSTNLQLLPGGPKSINLSYDPNSIGVKDTGQNQTMTVSATVYDSKNNPVEDSTLVLFTILDSPGDDETLSSYDPIPTVAGIARVSFSSGIRSGTARIRAVVVDKGGIPIEPEISATSTELIIHAGPPYMRSPITRGYTDLDTLTHLTVASTQLNIWRTLGDAEITVMVTDKYNNPVQQETAVYFTASGGGISTHKAYTDEYGLAQVILRGGADQPTIHKFYHKTGMQDPNDETHVIPGVVIYSDPGTYVEDNLDFSFPDTLIPNFEGYPSGYQYPVWHPNYPAVIPPSLHGYIGDVENSKGNHFQNDGVARIVASTVGMDQEGNTVKVWNWLAVIYSGAIVHLGDDGENSMLGVILDGIGESTTMIFELWDDNGNPIESGTTFNVGLTADVQAKLTPSAWVTDDGFGSCYYAVTISNDINPKDPKAGYTGVTLEWSNNHQYGTYTTQYQVLITLPGL